MPTKTAHPKTKPNVNRTDGQGKGITISSITTALSGSTGAAVLGATIGPEVAIIGAIAIGVLFLALAASGSIKK